MKEKLYQCSHCDEAFSRKCSLKYHLKTSYPYQCSYCDKAFLHNYTFKCHLRTDEKHGQENSACQCGHCDKVLTDKQSGEGIKEEKINIDNVKVSRKESLNEYEVPQTKKKLKKHSKCKIRIENKLPHKIMEDLKLAKLKKQNSIKPCKIEVIILSDSDDDCDIILSDSDDDCDIIICNTFIKGEIYNVRESKVMDNVNFAIEWIFDLLEESTEGKWKRIPNQIEQNLHDILNSLKLERYKDSLYDNHNMDVNYRQLYIMFSGVDDLILQHAVLCKHKYPNCKDIPDNHQNDMKCCV